MKSLEWREATAQMNKTPNTMKMDLGQNILENAQHKCVFSKRKPCAGKKNRGFLAAFQVRLLFMKFCIDGTPQGFWQPTEDDNMPC